MQHRGVRGRGRADDPQAIAQQGIGRDQLTLHADRGSVMPRPPLVWLLQRGRVVLHASVGDSVAHCSALSRPSSSDGRNDGCNRCGVGAEAEWNHDGVGARLPGSAFAGRQVARRGPHLDCGSGNCRGAPLLVAVFLGATYQPEVGFARLWWWDGDTGAAVAALALGARR